MKPQQQPQPERSKQPVILDLQKPRAGQPVRTVHFIEIGDMESTRFALLASKFAQEYKVKVNGDHFFIPVRHGRVTSDPYIEGEFLQLVEQLCEVQDGKIVFKAAAQRVQVIRNYVE